MKTILAVIEILLVLCLCHDCYSRSFYTDYEEYPNRASSGQRTLGDLVLLEPDESESPTGFLRSVGPQGGEVSSDMANLWQASARLTPAEMSSSSLATSSLPRGEDEISKRNNNNKSREGWGNSSNGVRQQGSRRNPPQQSIFRQNRNPGGFMKRQSILYRHCFFNPISCFHRK